MAMIPGPGKIADDRLTPPAQTPEQLLAALMAQGGAAQYPGSVDTTDYAAQAREIYAPQTDYLNNLKASSIAQADKSGKSLDALYQGLANNIAGQKAGINQNYAQGKTASTNAYNSAFGSTKAGFDQSRNGVADTLARLGIQEAGGNTVGKQSQMQALMQGILTANNQAQQNALTSGNQSALNFNQANVTGAKLRGGEAREGLAKQLNGFLNELGIKEADLQSKISEYSATASSNAEKTAYDRWRDSMGFDLDRQKMAMDAGQYAQDLKYKYDELASKSGNTAKLDPIGTVQALANRLYGNGQAASNAVKAVTDSISALGRDDPYGEGFTLAQLMNKIEDRNAHVNGGNGPGDLGELRQIAYQLYNSMYGK